MVNPEKIIKKSLGDKKPKDASKLSKRRWDYDPWNLGFASDKECDD